MADRIEEDVEPSLTWRWHAARAEIDDRLLGAADVVNPDVQVKLLGMTWVRPLRRKPFRYSLEYELSIPPCPSDNDEGPVFMVLVDLHAQHLAIEPCESARVGAVDDWLLKASDHARIVLRTKSANVWDTASRHETDQSCTPQPPGISLDADSTAGDQALGRHDRWSGGAAAIAADQRTEDGPPSAK